MLKHKKINFMGWKNCIEISSGDFRIVAASELGPRILGAFLGDSENLFYIDPETAGKIVDDDKWHPYGGHRLWCSPEQKPRCYTRDNFPVNVEFTENSLILSSGPDNLSGIAKKIEITPLGGESFSVAHTVTNCNLWPVTAGAWGISQMAPGGIGIFPVPQVDPDFWLPASWVSLWPYNTMDDGRATIGSKYLLLRQNPEAEGPIKIGLNCEYGWIAYQNKGITFTKSFDHFKGAEYPDNNCSAESYTNENMQEMETLSPLCDLDCGGEVTHVEIWHAERLASKPVKTEKDAVRVFGCPNYEVMDIPHEKKPRRK